MEEFKIENFINETGLPFPKFNVLTNYEINNLKKNNESFFKKVFDLLSSEKHLFSAKGKTWGPDIDNVRNNLINVFSYCKCDSHTVYLSWEHLSDFVLFYTKDVVEYFDYLWYPGPDDLIIFNDEFKWLIYIDHHSFIKFIDLKSAIGQN